MGNSVSADCRAPIRAYYSSTSWIEGAAVDQVIRVASLPDVVAVASMPDLHPGKYGPVGCAVLSDLIHPELVGSDVGCGFSVFVLDGALRKLRLDKAADRIRVLGEPWDGDAVARLEESGLVECGFAASLGSIGLGNHFCEVQAVADVFDTDGLLAVGLAKDSLCLLVHSGSRGLGTAILTETIKDGITSLDPRSEQGMTYRAVHDAGVRWASLNRRIVAERAAEALRMEAALVVDVPHNLLDDHEGRILHRKGASAVSASATGIVPVAGSRATLSHLVRWTGGPEAMLTLSHGAGRKFDRISSGVRGGGSRSEIEKLRRNPFGGYIVCEDKRLLVEEGPDAYKDCAKVVGDLYAHRLAAPVATLKPLVTFKTAREGGR